MGAIRAMKASFAVSALFAALTLSAAAAKSNWVIDPARTHIRFAIDAAGWPRTSGEFRKFDGRISVDFERPERSHVAFSVQSQSLDIGSSSFEAFVRGPAMLNADAFPTIAFESTSVEKTSDKSVRVAGDLKLLGVTKPLTVDIEVTRAEGRLEFSAHAHLNRLDWGFNSGFPIISKDVEIDITSAAKEL